jgi:ankyrin repeat protein
MRVTVRRVLSWSVVSLLCAAGLTASSDLRLIEAVKSSNIQAVRSLLKQRIDVNASQPDGATALHWAAHHNDTAAADLLLRAGARANVANDLGVTPLYLACTNRSAVMARKLLAAGANPNAALIRGETVLMECARTGDAAAVTALLAAGADVNAKEAINGQTALMWAVAQQHAEVVKVLLELGADIRARSRIYMQNVHTGDRGGGGEVSSVARGGSTPLLFAARVGDLDSTRLLLGAGADVNDSLPDGATALVVAAHSGHGAVGALLLEKGADPNATEVGYTALHAAIDRSDLALVKALLAKGADPNLRITKGSPARRDSNDFQLRSKLIGATAYLLAAKFVEVEIMRALAAGGADPHAVMPDGTTALMLAAGNGEARARDERRHENRRQICVCDWGVLETDAQVLDAVEVALSHGADVNAVNNAGDTALHSAAPMGYNSVVQALAEKGADLNVKNKRGQTPLATLTRGRGPAAAAAGDGSGAPAANQSTAALLRKLGAAE